jgi:methyl-accepting chemotaxis protein
MKAEVLRYIVAKVKIGSTGYAYLVDARSIVIAHPIKDVVMSLNLLDSAKSGWSGLDEVGKAMASDATGAKEYGEPDGSRVVAY